MLRRVAQCSGTTGCCWRLWEPAENSGANCASRAQVTEGWGCLVSTPEHKLFHEAVAGPADRASLWTWLNCWLDFYLRQRWNEAHTLSKDPGFLFSPGKKAGNAEQLSVLGVVSPKAEADFIGEHSAYGMCAWRGSVSQMLNLLSWRGGEPGRQSGRARRAVQRGGPAGSAAGAW